MLICPLVLKFDTVSYMTHRALGEVTKLCVIYDTWRRTIAWPPDKWPPDNWPPDKWPPDKWPPKFLSPRSNDHRTNDPRTADHQNCLLSSRSAVRHWNCLCWSDQNCPSLADATLTTSVSWSRQNCPSWTYATSARGVRQKCLWQIWRMPESLCNSVS